ncbi:MAG: winged helix DNA-binding protein [Sphingomonas sp.]|uniref:winged helix DNA-binding protein n=1 Tax=Sphingomonas sp. TaxID=28214 RepID=UPI001AD3E7FD|nr:winged helix DNA-binding protein [Sphingomonas sp.]MBN8808401.1 winged helix DNA-binding protein [Sphingomonas sp.]
MNDNARSRTAPQFLDDIQALLVEWHGCGASACQNPTLSTGADDVNSDSRVGYIRAIYRARRSRESVFGGHAKLFGEPAWDLLLDLYVARACGAVVSVTSACAAAAAAPSTALRHLAALEREGLVKRREDAEDRRRSHVALSDRGLSLLETWASTAQRLTAIGDARRGDHHMSDQNGLFSPRG